MIRSFLSHVFRRSSIFRFMLIPAAFLLFSLAFAGTYQLINKKPVLDSITPSIGESGDVIVLRGKHFGDERDSSWIEIGGDRLTLSSYINWTDTLIMATLPAIAEDGLVYVNTGSGKSNPLIFANKKNIPVSARPNTDLGKPVIESFDSDKTEIGKRLIITGRNFGLSNATSSVLFSWKTESDTAQNWRNQETDVTIACTNHDFDYEYWSDQEIRVRVPDGAVSGPVTVKTEKGSSNPLELQIGSPIGVKTFSDKKTYLLSVETSISGIQAGGTNMLYLRVPIPETSSAQKHVEVSASSPEPYMQNYRGTILHRLENLQTNKPVQVSHTFVVTTHAVKTTINPAMVKPYTDTKSALYTMYTTADALIPSDKHEITQLAGTIAGKEKNPYKKAELIYAWLTENIENEIPENKTRSPLTALSLKKGDAYDKAILFTALVRASGIPAIPVAGIRIDALRESNVHWWSEFYLEGFGWVPVDTSLAVTDQTPFGGLKAGYIAFSRGWTDQKPMAPESKIVQMNRYWAFLPVWEESAGDISGYSSFWSIPKVTGIY